MRHHEMVERAQQLFPGSEVTQHLTRRYDDCRDEFFQLLKEHYGHLPAPERMKAAFEALKICRRREEDPSKLRYWDRLRGDLQAIVKKGRAS